ncbi:TetR family transcriptional regulator [Streptomyces sp. NBC_00859]|uniref:TetR family transcriptional regulator n=1 Tax=Streptomyces sp. NBC_00859 TaxID=2903682 RepID=UPI00387064AE|nr:TetR/AcrR family transcriptional regulator [Streptomyces sp. NBC_00859]
MVIQERAARTRGALVRAAAEEIDRNGYEGAALARICKRAEVSMGALTFHFASKDKLADAVGDRGRQLTHDLVDRQLSSRASALCSVVDLTSGIAGLLEQDVIVRSAARLARECPDAVGCWTQVWLPAVRMLLEQAYREGELGEAGGPEAVADLAVHLMAGAEAHIRTAAAVRGAPSESAAARLVRIWQLALRGVSAAK